MSSIFSDPPFGRGRTLLAGGTATLDSSSNPIEGGGIVGEIKVFQDSDPSTGTKKSERLVYCVAVRAKQSGVANGVQATDLAPGKLVKFAAGSLTEIAATGASAGLAAASDTATITGMVGIVDEYLTAAPNVNDVFWVVVKGPTEAAYTSASITTLGTPVECSATAGSLAAAGTPALREAFFGVILENKGADLKARTLITNSAIV